MVTEFAFEMNQRKADGSFEHRVYGDHHRLPRNSIVRIYDANTGKGPLLYFVQTVNPDGHYHNHKLVPLPVSGK